MKLKLTSNPKMRRVLHALFFAILAAATLLVLVYAVENWRGARELAAARRDLQARGESLEWRDFIPPPVPDAQNLAMTPLFVRAFAYRHDPATGQLVFGKNDELNNPTSTELGNMLFGPYQQASIREPRGQGNWSTAHWIDLAKWQEYYRHNSYFPHAPQPQTPEQDVLLALSRSAPIFDELARAAAERPLTRFPVNWDMRPSWAIALPHYNLAVQLPNAVLRMRASAQLAAGQTGSALRDIELALRLQRGIDNEPCLIAALVEGTCLQIILQPVWEGLAARRWSAAELDRLSELLRGVNLLRSYELGIRGGERAGLIARLADDLQDHGNASEFRKMWFLANGEPDSASISWYWQMLSYYPPRGWYEQNMAVVMRLQQECLINLSDAVNRRVSLAKWKSADQTLQKLPLSHRTFLAQTYMPTFFSVIKKVALAQTGVDQAVVACSLEKYYLDRGAYPAALDALVPAYLDRAPADVIDGGPMHYRLTVDGRYQLYSIGWDGEDGGGVVEWPADRKWRRGDAASKDKRPDFPKPLLDKGDWVWQYAPAEPPDPPANQSRLESQKAP